MPNGKEVDGEESPAPQLAETSGPSLGERKGIEENPRKSMVQPSRPDSSKKRGNVSQSLDTSPLVRQSSPSVP
eukprot:CAMPEP_0184323684 /NCGR_PEP_ID=MMETSP1049-20130417/131594_1 /TAXON_ID=77928 /ORGANISM="Proteomonas sulcata, Strain CCMP704" /LENGTH=72 /DNA_ID=CAMNT_0026645249 /DNA_START=155 /DNA_END=370 /DNA_ORIENTATION=+